MPKRIIVCCDGTANDAENAEQEFSNVTRFGQCVSEDTPQCEQLVGYMRGVGTGKRSAVMRTLEQGLGNGIDRNIMIAYAYICENRSPGDTIILVGFSRGAFTARCVAALVSDLGLLDPERLTELKHIYARWTQLSRDPQKQQERCSLWKRYHTPEESRTVHACAVWDTVSSLHLSPPASHLNFVNTELPAQLKCAFQALALEEPRGLFQPEIWSRRCQFGQPASQTRTVVKQCWFRGVHTHVGGSSPQWDNNIANCSLVWMIEQLRTHQLVNFDLDQLESHISSDGGPEPSWQQMPMEQDPVHSDDNYWWRLGASFTHQPAGHRNPGRGIGESIHWSVDIAYASILFNGPVPDLRRVKRVTKLTKLNPPITGWCIQEGCQRRQCRCLPNLLLPEEPFTDLDQKLLEWLGVPTCDNPWSTAKGFRLPQPTESNIPSSTGAGQPGQVPRRNVNNLRPHPTRSALQDGTVQLPSRQLRTYTIPTAEADNLTSVMEPAPPPMPVNIFVPIDHNAGAQPHQQTPHYNTFSGPVSLPSPRALPLPSTQATPPLSQPASRFPLDSSSARWSTATTSTKLQRKYQTSATRSSQASSSSTSAPRANPHVSLPTSPPPPSQFDFPATRYGASTSSNNQKTRSEASATNNNPQLSNLSTSSTRVDSSVPACSPYIRPTSLPGSRQPVRYAHESTAQQQRVHLDSGLGATPSMAAPQIQDESSEDEDNEEETSEDEGSGDTSSGNNSDEDG